MKKIYILAIMLLLCNCGSLYSSMEQVRETKPQRELTVDLPIETVYENVFTQTNECFVVKIYKILSIKRTKSAEIAVIAPQQAGGANVWLSVMLEEVSTN